MIYGKLLNHYQPEIKLKEKYISLHGWTWFLLEITFLENMIKTKLKYSDQHGVLKFTESYQLQIQPSVWDNKSHAVT